MKALVSAFVILVSLSIAFADPFVVLVRHAEKGTNSDKDPDLSPAGVARANALARMLKDAGIVAIFVTEFKRTQETAAATARLLGITPTVIPANDTATLVGKLRELKGNALVVGHGNSLPDLAKAIGISTPISIPEDDYTDIFVVTLNDRSELFRLHYPNDLPSFNGYNVKTQSSPNK